MSNFFYSYIKLFSVACYVVTGKYFKGTVLEKTGVAEAARFFSNYISMFL
jgi:hypothetical protein